ncbi:unnamed protein product [Symbiodinium sp. CCMP2592]|nr:unnamed protein product [Symbiodinium sp. CCMP2592]
MYVCMYVCMYVRMYKCLGPIRRPPLFLTSALHGQLAMPRSLASSPSDHSSSSSSDSSSTARSDDSSSTKRARARAKAAALRAKEARRMARLLAWFTKKLVVMLCEQLLEAEYKSEGRTTRQVAGMLSSLRRRSQNMSPLEVVAVTRPSLSGDTAQGLQADSSRLLAMLETPIPDNDYTWMFSDKVGNIGDPTRQQVQQHLQLLLVRGLARSLHTPEPERFVQQAVVYASFGWYVECLWLTWHLLSDDDRRAFQRWYHRVPTDSPDAIEDQLPMELEDAEEADNEPEPARGSRDPRPPVRPRQPQGDEEPQEVGPRRSQVRRQPGAS